MTVRTGRRGRDAVLFGPGLVGRQTYNSIITSRLHACESVAVYPDELSGEPNSVALQRKQEKIWLTSGKNGEKKNQKRDQKKTNLTFSLVFIQIVVNITPRFEISMQNST